MLYAYTLNYSFLSSFLVGWFVLSFDSFQPPTLVMKYIFGILAGAVGLSFAAGDDIGTNHKYRISPMDGSIIALPTQKQLDYQDKEITALIHFEIATWLDTSFDGCNKDPSLVPNITLFDPTSLSTDQWMESIVALGAKSATLVAKHNCGFITWPSNVTFATRDGDTIEYNYTIADSPVAGTDMVKNFVDSAGKYQVGVGFYYSTVVNNFLNVQKSVVNGNGQALGQVRISNETYDGIVNAQLTELWSKYGGLAEASVLRLNIRRCCLANVYVEDLVRWRI